ncbi:hypothetical protein SAMN05877753_10218 [Bacillus oleivorans]|uniref:Uncharacterized protein n=1 Tax=Bacillus oleivorans TaxID=1448271 RepID=A0A285CJP2_9BACI|nr:hypothetical protein [Bacillus oleivorans]SNX67814.1 hypothetical protein SAMN05877753_10218 [Bacillus oleivorans]
MATYTIPVEKKKIPSPPKTNNKFTIQNRPTTTSGKPVSTANNAPTATATTTSVPKTTSTNNGWGLGYGTIKENNNQAVKWADKNAEIERTINVIQNREDAGQDLSAQLAHYRNLTGKEYTPSYERQTEQRIKAEVDNYIKNQSQAINDAVARQIQQNQAGINANNAYLSEQIQKFQEQNNVADQQSTMLQNRRGGFYSGGLDYQLGQNAKATQEASGALSRDIAARNAEIYAQNSQLAEQAANQIKQLQMQAPDLVRSRVQEALNNYRAQQMQESQLTGMYNGSPTMQMQAQQFQQQLAQAGLTGMFNGQPTLEAQQIQFSQQMAQQQFAEDVRQFGLQFALQRQVQLGNMSMDQARLALAQQQFNFDQNRWQSEFNADQQWRQREFDLATMPQPADLAKYTGQLNNIFLRQDDEGNYSVNNPEGLYRAIIGLNLDDNSTMSLLSMYGLDIGNFLNP